MIELITVIFWLGFCLNVCLKRWLSWGEKFWTAFITGIVAVVFIALVPYVIGQGWPIEIKRDNCSAPIYSLRNGESAQGQFFMGSGFIDSVEFYYMFGTYSDGGMYRIRLRSDNCVVYQRNETPRLEWQVVHYTYPKWAVIWPKVYWTRDTRYSVIVPTNTIVEQFKLN